MSVRVSLSSSPHPARPSLEPSSSQSRAALSDSDDEPDWLKPTASTSKLPDSATPSTLKRTRSLLASSPSASASAFDPTSSLPPSSPPTSSSSHLRSELSLRRSPRRATTKNLAESEPKRARLGSSPPPTPAAPAAKPPLAAKPKAGPVNLHSFFSRVSPRRATSTKQTLTSPTPRSSRALSPTKPALAKKKAQAAKPAALTQLYLDPFEAGGHSTISCNECSLTYARTPEDMAVHVRHHAKVVAGCDWPAAATAAKAVTVLEDGVAWNGGASHEGGKVLMVDADATGVAGKRLADVLEMIDTSLSATGLSQEQLAESKAFLFVTAQRKVIACALVQRITHAFRVIDAPSDEQTARASSVVSDASTQRDAPLIQFGDEQDAEGAIFCSPTPLPTLLGVHRIWTSPSHRRSGLASLLLNAAAQRTIYGCPIPRARRGTDVAFSQPTGKGQALARSWVGGGELRVFVD